MSNRPISSPTCALLAACALLYGTAAFADTTTLSLALDADNNAGTGCSIATVGSLSSVGAVSLATWFSVTAASRALGVAKDWRTALTFGAFAASATFVGLGLGALFVARESIRMVGRQLGCP